MHLKEEGQAVGRIQKVKLGNAPQLLHEGAQLAPELAGRLPKPV